MADDVTGRKRSCFEESIALAALYMANSVTGDFLGIFTNFLRGFVRFSSQKRRRYVSKHKEK
jgi:hypothetical protein